MLMPSTLSVQLFVGPCDMRKSIDGLSFLVTDVLAQNPCEGTLFVFINRAKNKLKVLYFDGTGFCLLYKRLSKGCFFTGLADRQGVDSLTLSSDQLAWLVQGFDWKKHPRRPKAHYTLYA